ncbi:alpha/beta hydrolase, partial [Streptomyces sp. bgisy153]|uniref:alpha/beta hydrolase n=1 Tax=Streptomyces sp. bgisy153 TaxID=3413793 RepID=UPI003D7368AB
YPPGGEKDEGGTTPAGGTVTGLTDDTASAVGRQAANIDPNPNHGPARDCADRIAAALEEATEVDVKWAPKLRALRADDDLTVSDDDWSDVFTDTKGLQAAGTEYLGSLPQPPKDGDPKSNAQWWQELDPDQQAAWLSMRPDSVGALDGLPSAVRDEANRIIFADARSAAQTELDAWMAKEPQPAYQLVHSVNALTGEEVEEKIYSEEWRQWDMKRNELQKPVDGMQAIQDRFNATGKNGLPEAYLLSFSPEGDGRVIIANGNPDTADHQAVYVPGTTSNLSNIEGNINRMVGVWREADAKSGGESVSTITWLGYDAPDSVAKDAPFSHYAYDGAPAFNRFLDGLDASHGGVSDPHRTVIGHSYGSTLVGAAAETGQLNADDVIFAGSPGVRVSGADEMDVPQGHVWNEEAEGDPVPDLGRWGHGGDRFVIPSDPNFGANQMATDTEGHSGYWDGDEAGPSQSLLNQALVVVGKGDDVPLRMPRPLLM